MSNYRYQIENYHSIGKADIAINGITVLAGVNGAGKSTLARWLYYIVNVAYIYETNRFEEYQQSLANMVGQFSTAKKEFPENNLIQDFIKKDIQKFVHYLMNNYHEESLKIKSEKYIM